MSVISRIGLYFYQEYMVGKSSEMSIVSMHLQKWNRTSQIKKKINTSLSKKKLIVFICKLRKRPPCSTALPY